MRYGDGKGLKSLNVLSNELFRSDDLNYMTEATYLNAVDILSGMVGQKPKVYDYALVGLDVVQVTNFTMTVRAGYALSFAGSYYSGNVWGYSADGGMFAAIVPADFNLAVNAADPTNPRIDTLEIRPSLGYTNSKSRQFRDPITSLTTSALMNTQANITYEVQIKKGTPAASPVAPSKTTGWIKLAEVRVNAAATEISAICDCSRSKDWTTNTLATIDNEFSNVDLSKGLVGYWNMDAVPEIPDNASGVTYRNDAAWTGWVGAQGAVASVVNGALEITHSTYSASIEHSPDNPLAPGKRLIAKVAKAGHGGVLDVYTTTDNYFYALDNGDHWLYSLTLPSAANNGLLYFLNSAGDAGLPVRLLDLYIGDGSYATPLLDNSGAGHHGTIYGAVQVEGVSGKALSFDGVNDYVELAGFVQDETKTAFSMSFWAWCKTKAPDTTRWRTVVDNWNAYAVKKGFLLSLSNGNTTYAIRLYILRNDGTDGFSVTYTLPDISTGWHQFGFVFTGATSVVLYYDGVAVSSTTASIPATMIFNATCYLGKGLINNGQLDGTIDEPLIFSRALSEEEVYALYKRKSLPAVVTSAATPVPTSLMLRNAGGRAQVNNPVVALDVANKTYIDTVVFSNYYDLVVDSDAKLDQWIQHTSGLYKRVLIRAGTWTASAAPTSNTYIDLTRSGTRYVFAEPGSLLVFNNALTTSSAFYSTAIADSERDNYHFIGVKVSVYTSDYTGSIYGFNGLVNLDNCNAVLTIPSGGLVGSSVCFTNCLYLNDCVAEITSLDGNASGAIGYFNCKLLNKCNTLYSSSTKIISLYAFYQCNGLSLCSVNLNSLSLTGGSAYSAFANCTELSSCSVSCTSVTSAVNLAIVGYDGCTVLASCKMYAVSYNRPITGFKSCDMLSSCFCNLVTHGEYAVGFQTCNYISSCNCTITQTAAPASMLRGFALCKGVSSCYVNLSGNANVECTGFHSCTGVSVCIVGAVLNAGTGAGYGFNTCTKTINNKCSGTTKTGKYTASYADINTNACALTAAGGYND